MAELKERVHAIHDGRKIVAMVIPLNATTESGEPLFGCSHWDTETKRCMDYENRPTLCREYPYGGACEHCGGMAVESAE